MPITEDGTIGSKLVGLCTKRDLDLVDERHEPLSQHMTPVDQLILGREGCPLEEAQEIIKVSKKGDALQWLRGEEVGDDWGGGGRG